MGRLRLLAATSLNLMLAGAVEASNFIHSSDAVINSDFISGSAFGQASGERALPTHVESSFNYWLNPGAGTLNFFVTITAEGIWGDPAAPVDDPYYLLLQGQGLHTALVCQFAGFNWDGTPYALDNPVFFTSDGWARIDRNIQYQWLQGYFSGVTSGLNAIPINASSRVLLFDPNHPAGAPDYEVQFTSQWLVTSAYHPVPEPGLVVLLAVALPCCSFKTRRRRVFFVLKSAYD